jgi:hypothetical protein
LRAPEQNLYFFLFSEIVLLRGTSSLSRGDFSQCHLGKNMKRKKKGGKCKRIQKKGKGKEKMESKMVKQMQNREEFRKKGGIGGKQRLFM